MFDSDRRSLKKAYAKNALFSCRIHDAKPNSCASLFIPEGREAFRSTRECTVVYFVPLKPHTACSRLERIGVSRNTRAHPDMR